jgi:hypothetical protein
MSLAPAPQNPENAPNVYETKMAPSIPGNRGPLRFEEGIATDSDIPSDFQRGMMESGMGVGPGQNGVDPNTQYKHADETLRERAHVGSASWVDSPMYLGSFAGGSGEGNVVEYVQESRDGSRYENVNAAVVRD